MSEDFELLVLGAGPAGFSTVRAFREAGGAGAVAIVGDEGRMPYNRPPLTKELLRGEQPEQELPLAPESWLVDQQVSLITGRAVEIETTGRVVTLSGGRRLHYVDCVLATGAEPKRLSVPGTDDPAVRVVRALDDVRELLGRLGEGEEVAVIGSGFIGCEIAASLRMRGHPVTLVSDEVAPNADRLGDAAAVEIRGWLEGCGVDCRLGSAVQRIERDPAGGMVVVTEAERARGALVVMAAGVTPRVELAIAAGLELAGGAVAVDDAMRTSEPSLLAAGDVAMALNSAAGRRLRVEHWGDALGQGRVAGATAAGKPASWSEVPGFWSTIGRHTLKYAAWGDGFDAVQIERHGQDALTIWYGRGDRYVGVLTHEADEDYERGRKLIAEGESWRF